MKEPLIVMINNYKHQEKILQSSDQIKEKLNITGKYFVVTIHRPSNLSDENLAKIFCLKFWINAKIVKLENQKKT